MQEFDKLTPKSEKNEDLDKSVEPTKELSNFDKYNIRLSKGRI